MRTPLPPHPLRWPAVFCLKRKTMWFIGVEVEQKTSPPPNKKNPGSTPVIVWFYWPFDVGLGLQNEQSASYLSSHLYRAIQNKACTQGVNVGSHYSKPELFSNRRKLLFANHRIPGVEICYHLLFVSCERVFSFHSFWNVLLYYMFPSSLTGKLYETNLTSIVHHCPAGKCHHC